MNKKIMKSAACIFLSALLLLGGCASKKQTMLLPGRDGGSVLLPNGWKLNPAGTHIGIGEFPMNMVISKDGRYALTSNSGMGENSVSVVDINSGAEVQRFKIGSTWRGIALDEQYGRLFLSGGNNNVVYICSFQNGSIALADSIVLGKRYPKDKIGVAGLWYNPAKDMLAIAARYAKAVYLYNVSEKKELAKIAMPEQCYDICDAGDGKSVFVSVWGAGEVQKINTETFEVSAKIKTADHPCEMLLSEKSGRLFVACANTNIVSVIDIETGKETERLISSLLPSHPPGSTPNSLCFDEDEETLFIANADNNCLAVFDIREAGASKSIGFIPVGWYPTAVRSCDNRLIVANGKGGGSRANLLGPNPYRKNDGEAREYIGSLLKGSLSIITVPGAEQLAAYSAAAYAGLPKAGGITAKQSVIPEKHGKAGQSPIHHVFYIIKENRTYDQVYGDMPQGNGDTALCLFPAKVTPNQHALAAEFTLFDNFYVDAEVSADGHNWSTAAYATDYVEKIWPVYYGGRGGNYEFEGGMPIAAPTSGYIWDAAVNAGKTVRDYGEFSERVIRNGDTLFEARDARMAPFVCTAYPSYDLGISDLRRFAIWKEDFNRLSAKDSLPHLNIIRLPNNHTMGTLKGALSPTAYVAQNDYALGLMVEHISKSKYWKNSIIFVLEDDAQNGADHVDAHRSCLLVLGPHVRKSFVDHTMYSTSGVLKTIELILGLQPMTQYDLLATPILNCITDDAEYAAFKARPAGVNLDERNPANAYGALECEQMNFAQIDAVPDIQFNRILWKAIKGAGSEMPAPVRHAGIRVRAGEEEDD